ncbi:MAG: 16S rRNA (uracil(1498)-N(3))-methyltransferase [Gammaproteobacteria bacterium]
MSAIPRVFVDCALADGIEVTLPAVSAHHVRTVLRLARNAELVLLDGRGAVHEARLTLVSREAVHALVGPALATRGESPLEITLVQSISRGERMDYTLQKAVELGVRHIVPVVSRRTVVRLDQRREDRRLEHWAGVVRHAAEQSERALLPTLAGVTTLDDWLAARGATTAFLLQPGASAPLARQPRPTAAVALLAGPEGGFDPGEVERMLSAGAHAVSLGPRVLRTETAAVAALAVMQALWGDLA